MMEMEMEEVMKILGCIKERKQKLENYTEKLRESIEKIVCMFGPSDECVFCGYKERLHPYKFSATGEVCNFKPKIDVPIHIIDDKAFYVEVWVGADRTKYYLAFYNHELKIAREDSEGVIDYIYLIDLSNDGLKALIKSGRLIKFLKKAADELEKTSQEYKEISEIAEKMANAITEVNKA